MAAPSAVFLLHLVQDVNVLRPLIFMAARDFRFETQLLVATKFLARDMLGIWRQELETIAREAGASIHFFDDDWDAHRQLAGRGLLLSASESDLPNHALAHGIFRHAPADYLRVTLQHGFECVGFRHSADHVRAHGATASFAADFLCTWTEPNRLPSLAPSQQPKVVVTGPSLVLQQHETPSERSDFGLICENLHSVRFANAERAKMEFVNTFAEFSRLMALDGKSIRLRPHPGGQYFLKNRAPLPANVSIENAPTYRLDLGRYAYGISAPSSVLIELLLARVPTAVWRDPVGDVDVSAYRGLATVSSAEEWVEFAKAAEADPDRFLESQAAFLEQSGMILEPEDVYRRFAGLFQGAARFASDGQAKTRRECTEALDVFAKNGD